MQNNPLLASVDDLLRGGPSLSQRFYSWLFPRPAPRLLQPASPGGSK